MIKELKKQDWVTYTGNAIHFATRVRKLIKDEKDNGNGKVKLSLGEIERSDGTTIRINYGADQASIQRTDRDAIHSTNNYEIIPYWRNTRFDFSSLGINNEKEAVKWMRRHAKRKPYV
mgnify:CR=1 FL=1